MANWEQRVDGHLVRSNNTNQSHQEMRVANLLSIITIITIITNLIFILIFIILITAPPLQHRQQQGACHPHIHVYHHFHHLDHSSMMVAPLQHHQQQGGRHHRRYTMQRWFGTRTVGRDCSVFRIMGLIFTIYTFVICNKTHT